MTRRLNLTQAVVVPWQLPDIDAAAAQTDAPNFRETAFGAQEAEAAPAAPVMPVASPVAPAILPDPVPSQAQTEGFERGLAEGREQGYAEGFLVGQRAAEMQFVEQLERLQAIVRRLGEPMRALERPVEEAVIALALEVARWVIGNEVTVSRDHLVGLIRDAVGKVPIDVGVPSIVLHPADAELIRALAPDFEANGIPLVADDTIEPGGCLVVADGADGVTLKDRRWHPRARQAICEVDLTLASRWRDAMFAMFEGEDA